jgi:hypothetical protein
MDAGLLASYVYPPLEFWYELFPIHKYLSDDRLRVPPLINASPTWRAFTGEYQALGVTPRPRLPEAFRNR